MPFIRRATVSALLTAALVATAALALGPAATPDDLVGTWQVDLRPTPDAAPYLQEMIITSVAGDSITGTFYGSPIRDGRLNADWGALRFAFLTDDGSGAYHTSGTLRGDQIEGLTHALGRDFLAYWTAERVAADEE